MRLADCQFHCDNSGLVQTLQTNQEYVHIFSNQYLRPDRDQIDHILSNLRHLPDSEIEHVKGHQDKNSRELDLPATLNVRADELAGWYNQHHPKHRRRVHVTAEAGAQLHIHGKTVNSNYRQHIRDAVHGLAHRQYLCEQHQWGDIEAHNIDWAQFAHLNQEMHHLRVWKAKFINDLLPTVRTTAAWTFN